MYNRRNFETSTLDIVSFTLGYKKTKVLGLIKLFSLVSYGLFAEALKIKLKEHCCCNCMSNDYSII